MNKNLFLRTPDEDVDFLPIIPLNEAEAQSDEDLSKIDTLALLPLRNTVLFPGVVLPITVGRDKSIQAVNEAYKDKKLIGVVAQKDSNVEDPTINHIEDIGSVAKIVKLIKMPDGGKTGTTHGLWNPYDSHIPLVWYGWNIKPGRSTEEVYMTDIAATLAAMLHIQMPNGCVGKPIQAVLK